MRNQFLFSLKKEKLLTCIVSLVLPHLLLLLLLSHFSRVRLYATPETAAHQALPSPGFSRQEHWSGFAQFRERPSPGTPCALWVIRTRQRWSTIVTTQHSSRGVRVTREALPLWRQRVDRKSPCLSHNSAMNLKLL